MRRLWVPPCSCVRLVPTIGSLCMPCVHLPFYPVLETEAGFTHALQVLCRRAISLSLYCLTFIFKWGLTKVLRQALNSSPSIFSLLSSWNYRIATPSQAHLLFKATGLPQSLASLWGACMFMMFGAHYVSPI